MHIAIIMYMLYLIIILVPATNDLCAQFKVAHDTANIIHIFFRPDNNNKLHILRNAIALWETVFFCPKYRLNAALKS